MLYPCQALALIIGAAFALRPVLGHCKLVDIAAKLSQPGPRSHGFGVDRHGKYPWHVGERGDAGADAIFYSPRVEYVANPQYPCGKLATLPKGLDVQAYLSQADAEGVATTASDGSFEALIFQVNRDGAGACTCEYDPSATAKSWNKCQTLVNPPGIQGMWQSDRTNHTATFQMPSSTVCKGGAFKDKCLVRIRCGWKLRFGGCFAIKTPSSPKPLQLKVVGGGSTGASTDVNSLAAKVFNLMRAQGALTTLGTSQTSHKHSRANDMVDVSAKAPSVDAVALKVIQMIKSNNLRVVEPKAQKVAKALASSN